MATHSSVLTWRIPGMGEPGGLPSMGLHRVRQEWSDLAAAAADLWPKMLSILENAPCALEKKVYSSAFEWTILKISMRPIWSNLSFKAHVSLLIFCFHDLSIGVREVLKSPSIIVLLWISSFMSVSVCLMFWGASMLGAYIFTIVMSSSWKTLIPWLLHGVHPFFL